MTRPAPCPDHWLSLYAAADYLGILPDTLRQQIHAGRLTASKLGGSWHVRASEVERYRAEQRGRGWPRVAAGA